MADATRTAQAGAAATTGHRKLRFESLDEMLDEVRRIGDAERGGCLRRLGNWSPGQAFGHLAAWMNFAFDGYPIRPPWFIRLPMRLMKRRMISNPMPLGVRIPRIEGGTVATEDLPLEVGQDRLARAAARLRDAAPTAPNPMLGHLTHQQWIALNLRHAECHLGFFAFDG